MNSHCVYCRKVGHVKAFCPVLKEKIEQKKSLRTKKQQEKKFSNIVKKFGTSEERMNDLYREGVEMIRAIENLEAKAKTAEPGSEFNRICDELASMEGEYEYNCAFLNFLDGIDVEFSEKKTKDKRSNQGMYEVLKEKHTPNMDSSEKAMEVADEFYWRGRYKEGRQLFYNWWNTTKEKKNEVACRFKKGTTWNVPEKKNVLDIRKSLAELN